MSLPYVVERALGRGRPRRGQPFVECSQETWNALVRIKHPVSSRAPRINNNLTDGTVLLYRPDAFVKVYYVKEELGI